MILTFLQTLPSNNTETQTGTNATLLKTGLFTLVFVKHDFIHISFKSLINKHLNKISNINIKACN